ncbi:MAG: response regulator, partial [Bryobacteraceae bacterium]
MNSVFVCESQPIAIEGLRSALRACEDLEVVGSSAGIAEGLDAIEALQPNIVLVDQSIGTKPTFDLLPKIRVRASHAHIVLWITNLTEAESFRALQVGARG